MAVCAVDPGTGRTPLELRGGRGLGQCFAGGQQRFDGKRWALFGETTKTYLELRNTLITDDILDLQPQRGPDGQLTKAQAEAQRDMIERFSRLEKEFRARGIRYVVLTSEYRRDSRVVVRTAIMLVTHDMGVIAETADRVAVMYAGRIAEIGPVREVVQNPLHPYAQGLMGAIPSLAGEAERLVQIPGAMPRLSAIPPGCPFHPRCPFARDLCHEEIPAFRVVDGTDHWSACHYAEELEQVGVEELRSEEAEEAPA